MCATPGTREIRAWAPLLWTSPSPCSASHGRRDNLLVGTRRRATPPPLGLPQSEAAQVEAVAVARASAQIALGTNLKWIPTRLGHATISITVDRRGHLLPDEHRAAARRLEAMQASGIDPAEQYGQAVARLSR